MKVVRENLRIIEGILHSGAGEELSPTPLIELLKSEIYPIIDNFIWDSTIVISDRLNVDMDCDQITLFSRIAERARLIDKSDPVNMLIQDLKYLIEMKRLEGVQTSEKLLHIVPIGGLVLNNFHRQWNELKTVIELWGHRENVKQASDNSAENNNNSTAGNGNGESSLRASSNGTQEGISGRTILHQKVFDNQLDEVVRILASDEARAILNKQDIYGWTPLHVCSHAGNLEMCKALLAHDDTSVTLENTDGNTALHYIVRNSGSSDVIKLMLEKKADPNTKNKHAETALHCIQTYFGQQVYSCG
jgi:hypothetical protein